ncbi:hypothetical protein FHX74_000229 [Friedmanniella endophytica]|uniref:Pyrrolo-quinoline quinone repeat domain-containing protein n=1 Tax=Microlunatus kandeliicorticis TaxID=1759536 RepID=A0A7W3IP72_9ACTN|nr:PQQ-binding-like beta-propeller repeat protein [Microlunatus kandeliicorticis]MBA8792635.1 hypothetical protein [Microlunatus kandeliicorticis]
MTPHARPPAARSRVRAALAVGALTLLVASALAVPAAPPAGAATPPPIVTTTNPTVVAGRPMEVFVGFFPTDHLVRTYLGVTPLAELRTGSSGSAETYVPVPVGLIAGPTQLVATDALTGLTVTTPVTVRTDWQQQGSDPGHAGSNPGQQLLTPSTVGQAVTRWQVTDPGPDEIPSQPVVTLDSRGASRVLVLRGARLTASRTTDGGTVWERTFTGSGYGTDFAAGPDGFGYVVRGGSVSRIDLFDGSTVWTKDLGLGASVSAQSLTWASRIEGAVVVTANTVPADPAVAGTGLVACYDAVSGRLLWAFRTGVPVTEAAVQDGSGPPARVFVGTTTGKVFALSLTDSALLWSVQTGAQRLGRPSYADGTVVFAATTVFGPNPSGPVGAYAFTADRGRALWHYDTGYGVGTATRAAIAGGTAYLGFTESGYYPERAEIRAVDLATGSTRWVTPAPFQTAWERGMSDPAVAGGVVYLGSCGPNHLFLGYAAASGTKLLDLAQNCGSGAPANQRLYLADQLRSTALGLRTEVAPLAVLNDSVTGTGAEQIDYSGGWRVGHTAGEYRGDDHYSYTMDATATVRFTGTGVRWWYTEQRDHGIAAVSIDGGPETLVNQQTASGTVLAAWTSPVLSRGPHVLRVRVTGTKSNGSTSSVVTLDRVDVVR